MNENNIIDEIDKDLDNVEGNDFFECIYGQDKNHSYDDKVDEDYCPQKASRHQTNLFETCSSYLGLYVYNIL